MKRFVMNLTRGEHLSYANIINTDEGDNGDWCRYEDVQLRLNEERDYWMTMSKFLVDEEMRKTKFYKSAAITLAITYLIGFLLVALT